MIQYSPKSPKPEMKMLIIQRFTYLIIKGMDCHYLSESAVVTSLNGARCVGDLRRKQDIAVTLAYLTNK